MPLNIIMDCVFIISTALKVIVNPSHLVLSEGNPAEVLCVGLGNLIEDMKWARDYKKIDNTIRVSLCH